MIAVLVVVVLFVKVLERFGLLEAGYDGKKKAKSFFFCLGRVFYFFSMQRAATCCSTLK